MELLKLEWNQINIVERLLYVNNLVYMTKTKKIRTLPLNNVAIEVLKKRQQNRNAEIIFTYNENPIKPNLLTQKFRKFVRKTNLNQRLKFHSLRHTFASWLVQKGVTIYDVSKLLGHSTIKSTEIYSHLRVDELRSAVDKLIQ